MLIKELKILINELSKQTKKKLYHKLTPHYHHHF